MILWNEIEEARDRLNAISAFFIPWITSFFILVFTIAVNMGGAICWIMIYPFFTVLAGMGGVVSYRIKKSRIKKSKAHDWENPNKLNIALAMLILVIVGTIEGERSLESKNFFITQHIVVDATPAVV